MPSGASTKVWLVTGASSGLGKAVVEYALSQGDKVSATCREPSVLADLQSKWPPAQLIVLKLDVASTTDITTAFARSVDAFGRIDVVYNNDRYRIVSEDGTTDDEARHLFDVNFWGAVIVSREAVKVFREVNKPAGGLLLQASSMLGVASHPGAAFSCARSVLYVYQITKQIADRRGVATDSSFALEGYLKTLSKEVHPSWNIRVKLLDIGDFATPVATSLGVVPIGAVDETSPEDSPTRQLRAWSHNGRSMGGDMAKAARGVYNISGEEQMGTLRIALGLDALPRTTGDSRKSRHNT